MTNLLSINQIIEEARRQGASFGHGDARVHLAYLTKLGLIPQSVRRKISGAITGCYPEETINRILEIEKLKSEGMSYSQIKFIFNNHGTQIMEQSPISTSPIPFSNPLSHYHDPSSRLSSSNSLAFLLIGLFLGFLAAMFNFNHSSSTNLGATLNTKTVDMTSSPLDNNSADLIKLTSNQKNGQSQPIYIIAVPQQNFGKLGKIDINSLNN